MKKLLILLCVFCAIYLCAEWITEDNDLKATEDDLYWGSYQTEEGCYFYIGDDKIMSVTYEGDGNGGLLSKMTVYADTIIIANLNAVVIWEER